MHDIGNVGVDFEKFYAIAQTTFIYTHINLDR